MQKYTILAILVIILVSGCIGTSTSIECDNQISAVDQVILDDLEDSDYITDLGEEGFELTRFRGPANSCSQIPDNYVHLNLAYNKDDFSYRLTIQTECEPSTMVCNFNSSDFF